MASVLLVSNGYGEDVLATTLATVLRDRGYAVQVCPLIGPGKAYVTAGFEPLCQQPMPKSGGFVRTFSAFLGDIKSMWGHVTQWQRLRTVSVDYVIAVGDVFALIMASSVCTTHRSFFPTAKSDRFMPHTGLERWVMKRLKAQVFPRDEQTAQGLRLHGVAATCLGNLMCDNSVPTGEFTGDCVAILPGSRAEARENLTAILEVVAALPRDRYVIAVPPSFQRPDDLPDNVEVSPYFSDVIHQAKWVIGLAGTANEQAVYAGKTVFAFTGSGPQTTEKRFVEQQHLLGDQLVYMTATTPKERAAFIMAHQKRLTPPRPTPHVADQWHVIMALKQGGVGLLPCDTIWGLVGTIASAETLQAIKEREPTKGFVCLCSDMAMCEQYADIPASHRAYVTHVWPGPTTLILPKKQHVPAVVTGGRDTIAIRLPDSPLLQRIISALGQPLLSTSANLSGQPYGQRGALPEAITQKLAFEYRHEDPITRVPSHIIACTSDDRVTIR